MGAQWKHKGRQENAAAKGQAFTKLAKEIMIAAKGGADPDMNSRLRIAIEAAKKASMPRETLERAVKKGAGLLDEQVNYELVTYEGFAPHQVGVIVECLTENKHRTAANVRSLFNKKGQLAATNAVSWDFDRLGVIEATPKAPGTDPEAAAIEAGAEEVEAAEQGASRFLTQPADLDAVGKALATLGWTVSAASLQWIAKNPVSLEGAERAEVEAFLEGLDGDDDVQNIYVGLR
jgi:YebC/PmpR family DNA-binding regulatory protein